MDGSMTIVNSTALFGPSKFVVGSSLANSSYLTIAAAVAAADAAGGGTVYVQPGTYTESITFTVANTVSVTGVAIGGFPGTTQSAVTVSGNQIYTGTGKMLFQGILFTASSGTTWTIGSAGSATAVQFDSCRIVTSGANGVNLNIFAATTFTMNDCSISAPLVGISAVGGLSSIMNTTILSTASDAISLGAGSILDISLSNILSTTNHSITLSAASAVVQSNNNIYQSTLSAIHYTAAATLVSTYDNFDSPAIYFADSTGAFGTLNYSYSTIPLLSSTSIDPQITDTKLSQIPIPVSGISSWNLITSSQTMAVNSGYIVQSGALSLLLPATSAVGDTISNTLDTGTSWTITQASGQRIRVGSGQTTLGSGGSLASTALGDSIEIVCKTADTLWYAKSVIGNLTSV